MEIDRDKCQKVGSLENKLLRASLLEELTRRVGKLYRRDTIAKQEASTRQDRKEEGPKGRKELQNSQQARISSP